MSLPSKVNKENFRLLDLSTDQESDLLLEIVPTRKKKIMRRDRNRINTPKITEPTIGGEVQCALKWAVRGTLLLWLLMLTWICAALYDQMSAIKLDMAKVSTSSNSVSDTLQLCHTTVREFRTNTSELNLRLAKLEDKHLELVKSMETARRELDDLSQKVLAVPTLAETPKRMLELQRTVANFGSQIQGFDIALTSAKKQAVAASSGLEEVKTLLHQLEGRTNDTIANVTANVKKENEINEQIVALNTTLQEKVGELQNRIELMNKPASTAAPTSPSSTSSSTTTSTSTTTSSPQGQPAKPNVLQ